MTLRITIVGGGHVGRALATRLTERGDDVRVIERDEGRRALIETTGADPVVGDGTDVETLAAADTGSVDVFVAATGDDDTNLLASQLALSRFDVGRVVAQVNRDGNAEPFEDLGIYPVPVSDATAREMDNYIERPSFTGFVEELSRSGDAQEVELRNPAYEGTTIRDLDDRLPEQCLVVMVSQEQSARFPDAELQLSVGDRLTVFGERTAVATARERLEAEEGTDHTEPSS